ncbi:nucleotidyltransferase [Virgibacillus sp. DJP39]|uniref:nucleotidyltransferase n=1 Tax=Virgibacillus sp. DJP39 TaxID=3409790 RepID=UPI003BB72735
MDACGLIVEYNPFHNGHLHHLTEAKKHSNAPCMIAVMSGNFLQRGEPAIIDKFHRAKAALASGVDIVLELPFLYAVQSSDLFAKGAVQTLNEIGVSSICFGSESGTTSNFITSYEILKEKGSTFKEVLRKNLHNGLSFPEASKLAYEKIGLTNSEMDLSQPNNILGFSYIKEILDHSLNINAFTVKRTKSGYHDQKISGSIASATSIRKQLINDGSITNESLSTFSDHTRKQLASYYDKTDVWHNWEHYFSLLQYRVLTMDYSELAAIHGVDEGLEYRIKKTAKKSKSINEWIDAIKTKRYTWTRIQRIFVHLLTNTKKEHVEFIKKSNSVPYVRVLGMTEQGQAYLNKQKKVMKVPIISQLSDHNSQLLKSEEQSSNAYYSILGTFIRKQMVDQELSPPIRLIEN